MRTQVRNRIVELENALAADCNDHVCMEVLLQAGEPTGFQLEIA